MSAHYDFVKAAEDGNLSRMNYYLDQVDNATYDTALVSAAENGHIEIVQFLLNNGANIHAENDDGDEDGALLAASDRGYVDVVKLLLENGANVHARYGYSLHYAAQKGHKNIVKILFENGADANADDTYIFQEVIKKGDIDIINLFLENAPETLPSTLSIAAESGNLDLVKLLLTRVEPDDTFLSSAAESGNIDLAKFILDKYPSFYDSLDSALALASREGKLHMVKYLIEIGADVNAHDSLWGNALTHASKNAHFEIVKFLLENGSDAHIAKALTKTKDIRYRPERFTKIIKLLESYVRYPLGKFLDDPVVAKGNITFSRKAADELYEKMVYENIDPDRIYELDDTNFINILLEQQNVIEWIMYFKNKFLYWTYKWQDIPVRLRMELVSKLLSSGELDKEDLVDIFCDYENCDDYEQVLNFMINNIKDPHELVPFFVENDIHINTSYGLDQYNSILESMSEFNPTSKNDLLYLSNHGIDVTNYVSNFKNSKKLTKRYKAKHKKFLESRLEPHLYTAALKADPTETKRHLNWLTDSIHKKTIDYDSLQEYKDTPIKEYQILKNKKRIKTDLDGINGYDELLPLLESHRDFLTEIDVTNQRTLYCENDDVRIYIPETEKAACHYGANTKWCTSAKNDNMFDHYNKKGTIYIIIPKSKPEEKYQLHIEEKELKNDKDEPVNIEDLFKYGPGVFECIKDLISEHIYSDEEISIYKPTQLKKKYGVTNKHDLIMIHDQKLYNVNSKGESKQDLDDFLMLKLISGLHPTALDLL